MSRSTQRPYFLAKGSVSWKEKAGLIPDFLAMWMGSSYLGGGRVKARLLDAVELTSA